MANKKRGGARKGAGRKSLKDKMIPIPIYIRKSNLKLLGGKNKFRMKVYNYIDHEVSLAVSPL